MDIQSLFPHRKPLLAAAAAIVVGGAALEYYASRPPATAAPSASWPGERLPMPASASGAAAPAPASSLVGDLSTFDKLVSLFNGVKDAPAAQRFAQEFMAHPELKKAIDDLKEDGKRPDPQQTLDTVADALAQKAEFRQLVAKFAQDPSFRDVMAKLSDNPEMQRVMGAIASRMQSSPSAARTIVSATALGRGAGQGALAGGASGRSSFARGAMAYVNGAAAAAGAGPSGSLAQGAVRVAEGGGRVDGGSAGAAGNGAGSASTNASDPAQQGGNNVSTNLAATTDPNTTPDRLFLQYFPWLSNLSASDLSWLEQNFATYGAWGGCFQHGILNQCWQACQASVANPTVDDSGQSHSCADASKRLWDLCTQAQGYPGFGSKTGAGADKACLTMCTAQSPPCQVPNDANGPICTYCNPNDAQNYAGASACSGLDATQCSWYSSSGNGNNGNGNKQCSGSQKGTIQYRCQWYATPKSGSNWRWVLQSGGCVTGCGTCSAAAAGWADPAGNSCTNHYTSGAPSACTCPAGSY